jgi:hypothetical protein
MRLEPEFWDALHEIQRERQDLSQLVRGIETADRSGGRTSAVRGFVVNYFHAATPGTSQAQPGAGADLVGRRGRGAPWPSGRYGVDPWQCRGGIRRAGKGPEHRPGGAQGGWDAYRPGLRPERLSLPVYRMFTKMLLKASTPECSTLGNYN